ncbi:MAG: hypothetical protein ACFE7E_00525 [Candidatus Hodarchaeota archaeon]
MKFDWKFRLAGGILAIIFLYILIAELSTFVPFQYAPGGTPLVSVPVDDISYEVSQALWNQRVIDILIQVMLLFAAAAGAAAMFRLAKRPEEEG